MINSHAQLRPAKGRPRKDDNARRDRILQAAYQAFVELGYGATTTDQVAARSHISKQTLYRLFASKEALFKAVVARHRRLMLDLPRPDDEDLPITQALERIFCLDLDEATELERHRFIRVILREASQVAGLAESFLQEGAMRSRQDLAEWLQQQHQRGKIQLDHPLSAAQMLMDIAFSTPPPLRSLPARTPEDAESRRAHLRRCFAIFERGLRR
ncbi:AcrR family transcriptional regulator [Agrobacterium vitis]|nr:AcrR family transcriptional regulator [Agrobacterium vitis]MBE1439231.1 AcrR family transcriptional regulator [Agrobacterium vitis]